MFTTFTRLLQITPKIASSELVFASTLTGKLDIHRWQHSLPADALNWRKRLALQTGRAAAGGARQIEADKRAT